MAERESIRISSPEHYEITLRHFPAFLAVGGQVEAQKEIQQERQSSCIIYLGETEQLHPIYLEEAGQLHTLSFAANIC